MKRALERKLTLQDFEVLTIAQIVDYIVFYDEDESDSEDEEDDRLATQDDFDRF